MTGFAALLLSACTPPTGGATRDTSTASTGGTGGDPIELPGATVPPADPSDLLGTFSLVWSEWPVLPTAAALELSATFWHDNPVATVKTTAQEAAGPDTCAAYTWQGGPSGPIEHGDAGLLTVTLDGAVLFEGEPNSGDDLSDALWYEHRRPEPAHGAIVGLSATGDGVIPPLDFPTLGILPGGPNGAVTPEPGADDVDLQSLVVTWANPLGSDEMSLILSAGYVSFECELVDDGEWAFPSAYLALVDTYGGGPSSVDVTLRRGRPRYVPAGDKVLASFVLNESTWQFHLRQ